MTDSDDLFEFGDLDDDDSLEIDLDDLFGDLEMLAIDVDVIEAGGNVAPVQAAAAPAPAPAPVAAPAAAPAPAPVAAAPAPAPVAASAPVAPQPVLQNQVIQPVAPAQQAYAQPIPAPVAASPAGKLPLTKTSVAIAFATIITLANVAVTMSKPSPKPNPVVTTVATSPNGDEAAGADSFEYRESMLQAQVDSLEARLLNVSRPAKPVPASYTEGEHPAFADVTDYFNAGLYPAGRQRLYNLLAIVDNFQPMERDAIEAKASYMLADSWRKEAELIALKESTND